MTERDAKCFLIAKLACLKQNTSITPCKGECDNCYLNYEQGNIGEQKKALEMAIKALEPDRVVWHWITPDGNNAICECCHRLNVSYGQYCKWCGSKMESEV